MRFLAILLFLGATAHAAPPSEWMGTASAMAEYVDEPVFGGRIALYRAGPRKGRPVVLVHGLGKAAARDWGRVIPALAARYAVYALDLPGFGDSDKGNHHYSPENFARVIEALLKERVKEPFALVGHSMGGAVALAYAAAYPQRVSGLVLVDAAGVLHRSVYAEFLGRVGAQRALGLDSPWFDTVMRAIQYRVENFPVRGDLLLENASVRQRILRGDPNAIAAYALVEHDFSETLPAIKAPTLIIWGAFDSIAPVRTGQALAAAIPKARLQVLEGLGHAPQIEAPQRFNPILLDELDGRQVAAPPYALPARPIRPGRAGVCQDLRGAEFSGDYDKIVLDNCHDAVVRDARVGYLRASNSVFRVVNSQLRDGLDARNSRVELTGVSLGGSMVLDATSVDAAAVSIDTPSVIASNYGDDEVAVLRFSVSRVSRTGYAPKPLHDLFRLAPGETLIR
jgi:pimeloyl-ACP methyl ester carboxylesterase